MIEALAVFALIELTLITLFVGVHVFRAESMLREQQGLLASMLTALERPLQMEIPFPMPNTKMPMKMDHAHNHGHDTYQPTGYR